MSNRESTTTPEQILLRIVDRLCDQINEANQHNTFISTLPETEFPNPSEFMFEVAPDSNWNFDQGHITGAGKNALHTMGLISVTLHSHFQGDQAGRDVAWLTNATRGILRLVTKVLDALSNYDLTDVNGNELLSEPLRPTGMAIPPKDKREKGWITLAFNVEFDWLLTPEEAPVP